jgi:uncharacterized membrane protein
LSLAPSLALAVAHDDIVRAVGVAAFACVVVVFGAWKRLQAPLLLGSAALAVAGVLLMWIGATFERRRDDARCAVRTLGRFG